MKAILLAAGLGTRLKPLSDFIPKCLVPIHGAPLLSIWLDKLVNAGVSDILINVHSHGEQVRNYIDSSAYKDRITIVEEPRLVGTAGTLALAKEFCGEDTIFYAHADNLSLFDINAFLDRHNRRPAGTWITMMTFRTEYPSQCGIVELGNNGVVVGFHEKVSHPPGNLANAAVYLIEPEVVQTTCGLWESRQQQQMNELDFSIHVIPLLSGRINTWETVAYHQDMGYWENLLQAQSDASVICYTGQNFPKLAYHYNRLWMSKAESKNISNCRRFANVLCETYGFKLKEISAEQPLNVGEGHKSLWLAEEVSHRVQVEQIKNIAGAKDDVLILGQVSKEIPIDTVVRQGQLRTLILSIV